ncbi:cation diffusion facilitator family transporter [Parasalinivibrio latis]|uniref:cation diffusion facilitator family transporter n=1 Tax=Parasalinivibrio latis TaxID=2952610 RepID=UPI0030E575B2
MSVNHQHTAEEMSEKMAHRYPGEEHHTHDTRHNEFREHEKSHPHTQHGGSPEGHKHAVPEHHHHENCCGKHHKTKEHDHKGHSREHHKTGHHE